MNYVISGDPHRGILDNCSDPKCATKHSPLFPTWLIRKHLALWYGKLVLSK